MTKFLIEKMVEVDSPKLEKWTPATELLFAISERARFLASLTLAELKALASRHVIDFIKSEQISEWEHGIWVQAILWDEFLKQSQGLDK